MRLPIPRTAGLLALAVTLASLAACDAAPEPSGLKAAPTLQSRTGPQTPPATASATVRASALAALAALAALRSARP